MSYRIAGIDVHKKMLAVVVSDVEVDGEYLLSYCGDQGFDSVAEATEFADHSISAVSS